MAEFVSTIVLLLMIVLGFIHIGQLCKLKLQLQDEARTEAAMAALSDAAMSQSPRNIRTWTPGEDERPGTADDKPEYSSYDPLGDLAQAAGDWSPTENTRIFASPANLVNGGPTVAILGFTRASRRDHIDVDPLIQELIYAKPHVLIEEEVWYPILGGML